jgi:hypothetical protein
VSPAGESPKKTPSKELWAVIGRWSVTPDSRPAAAVVSWNEVLIFVQPETVIAWRRRRFREHWTKLSRCGKPGRPTVPQEVRDLTRRVIHFNVTANPTAAWTSQQIVEAFPWQDPPKYLLRVRDKIYGHAFKKRVSAVGIEEVLTAARSPWQNPYVKRLIGTIRRDCLDHVIVFNERHVQRILAAYFTYYHSWRTHLSSEMDCPQPREIQAADRGRVVECPEIDGPHHHYQRVAA